LPPTHDRLSIARTARRIYREAPASTFALGAINQLRNAYIGVQPCGMAPCHLKTKETAPAMSQNKDLGLAELAADPSSHFLGVGDHPLARQRGRDPGRICEQVGFSRSALIPLNDCKIFFPAAGKPPTHRDRNVSWSAVDT